MTAAVIKITIIVGVKYKQHRLKCLLEAFVVEIVDEEIGAVSRQ